VIVAFVLIQARPDAIADLGPALADTEGVREVHSVAGSEVDLVAVLAVPDHEAIAVAVTEHISKLDGVIDTTTMIAFRQYSTAELDASYDDFVG
jgi:DNA-binding Lrp family transcriptional regulator